MSEEASPQSSEPAPSGTLVRVVSAVELLVSAHASRAKDEAARDLGRIAGALLLLGAAALFGALAVGILDVALALFLRARLGWPLPLALGAVAGGNVALALVLAWIARARLALPVLPETRATLRRAAVALRGP